MIEPAPEEEARLHARAAAVGKDVRTFVRDAAIEVVNRPTLSEIPAPIHAATDKAGVTVGEIDCMATVLATK